MAKIIKYEVYKNRVSGVGIKSCNNKEEAQDYIKTLAQRAILSRFEELKITKNTISYKKIEDTTGAIKYILFKIITGKNIPINPKEVKMIQEKFL